MISLRSSNMPFYWTENHLLAKYCHQNFGTPPICTDLSWAHYAALFADRLPHAIQAKSDALNIILNLDKNSSSCNLLLRTLQAWNESLKVESVTDRMNLCRSISVLEMGEYPCVVP